MAFPACFEPFKKSVSPGIYVLRLTASDTAATGVDFATVTVNSNPGSNLPPVVNVGRSISR